LVTITNRPAAGQQLPTTQSPGFNGVCENDDGFNIHGDACVTNYTCVLALVGVTTVCFTESVALAAGQHNPHVPKLVAVKEEVRHTVPLRSVTLLLTSKEGVDHTVMVMWRVELS
jgi:hypothetical protein